MENCPTDTSFIGYIDLVIWVIVGYCIYKYWDNHQLVEQKRQRVGAWIAGIIWILIGAIKFLEETAAAYLC